MSEKSLLLSSAKSGLLIAPAEPQSARWLRNIAMLLGCAVICVGGFDVAKKLLHMDISGLSAALHNSNIAFTAFAPAAALDDPSFITSLTSSAGATSSDAFIPSKIKIASIGVDTNVELVGKKADGSMDTPKDINNVGWYALGSKPGESGNAVFDGHVNNALSLAGVFAHLTEIKMGDYVTVASKGGKTLVYVVTKINQYPRTEAPINDIFSTEGPSQIALITCDGDWLDSAHTFDKRLVVVARLVHS